MDFEKLGVFYLGRPYDLAERRPKPGLTLYDSTDLVTHAVCVGMTGSGKTGLCLCLLEEAAIDGVPAIAIDPKGDLGNLLLTFPDLSSQSFAPWIDQDEAGRQGMSADQFASAQAELWKKGLAEWGQDGARIQRLRDAAEFVIYTPGSEAGLSISILRSFSAPPPAVRDDDELVRERVATTVSSLLGLVGLGADPLRSREHILLSTILERAWRAGQDLDLAALIHQIQQPAVERVGVLDLESFFPAKERFELAMAINNLIASPAFSSWMTGEPLDVGRFLHGPSGKPRVSIFSIAHLSEPQRMFFVSLLLNEVLGWVRTQTGSSSLRAILYMDEIAGYVPPVATPPSKAPLLTLMKQARAYGFGVVLATQNPADLDYKGLSNAGTWFLGRLQTERDKARVIEGLEGAAAASAAGFDRAELERTLSALGSRVFLMNNVHERAPEIFQTRWALSYLRGPLSRQDIKRLSASPASAAGAAPETATSASAARPGDFAASRPAPVAPGSGAPAASPRADAERPVLPPEVPQYFAPATGRDAPRYVPMLLGNAQVRYADTRTKVDFVEDVLVLTPIAEGPAPIDWTRSSESSIPLNAFAERPAQGGTFAPLPAAAARARSYDAWSKAFAAWLVGDRRLNLYYCEPLRMTSQAAEDERSFRIRLQQRARERRDAAVEQLRRKFAPKIASLQDRLRRAAQMTERQSGQVTQQAVQTGISMVATAVGMLFGRKSTGSALGRATTTARGMGRTMRERDDVARARENEAALEQQKESLERELAAEIETIESTLDAGSLPLEPLTLAPKKSHVTVRLVALAWVPGQDASLTAPE